MMNMQNLKPLRSKCGVSGEGTGQNGRVLF